MKTGKEQSTESGNEREREGGLVCVLALCAVCIAVDVAVHFVSLIVLCVPLVEL